MEVKAKLELLIEDYERNNNELSEYAKGRLSAFKTILGFYKQEPKTVYKETNTEIHRDGCVTLNDK